MRVLVELVLVYPNVNRERRGRDERRQDSTRGLASRSARKRISIALLGPYACGTRRALFPTHEAMTQKEGKI